MQNPPPARRLFQVKSGRSEGFTLAEVALAMAIFSFALVSMLGLLSVGLKSSRKANLQTIAANLLSTIAADLRASSVYPLPDSPGVLSYESPSLKIQASYDDANQELKISSETSLLLTDAGTNAAGLGIADLGVLKTFRVNLLPPLEKGVQAIRVIISWPSNIPANVKPEGSLDTLVPLPLQLVPL